MEEVLVLFSGGKDSLLSAVRYLDEGYKVNLVVFDNSCGIGLENIKINIKRLIKKYGSDKLCFFGKKDISAIFRNFIHPFYNYNTNYIINNYGSITISQFNCLACRMAMYVASIIICKQKNIKNIVDGARICQLFAIEQEEMLKEFKYFFNKYDLNIDYPVKYIDNDWDLKNELLIRGVIPKTIEPQCLLGCPITENIDKELVNSVCNVYRKYLKDKAIDSIKKYSNINICEEYV